MSQLRSPRTLAVALGLSLLANMFMGGFIVARLSAPNFMDRRPPRAERRVEQSSQDRPLRALMARHRESFKRSRSEVMDARHHVHDALVADPFDRAALERALTELQAATHQAQGVFHRSLLESAAGLSLSERTRLAEARRLWHPDAEHPKPPRP